MSVSWNASLFKLGVGRRPCSVVGKRATACVCACVQAAKSLRAMHLDVEIPDGRRMSVSVDSASTSSEMCEMIAANISIKDSFGFSLHVTIGGKVRPTPRTSMQLGSRDTTSTMAIDTCYTGLYQLLEQKQLLNC